MVVVVAPIIVAIAIATTTVATVATASAIPVSTAIAAPVAVTTPVTSITSSFTIALARHVLYRQDGLVQLSAIGGFLGLCRFRNSSKLNKCVVSLHVDSFQFSKRFKEHLQVFLFCSFLVKVHDKERFRGSNVLAAFIFLALDSSVSASEFGPDRARHVGGLPVLVCACVCVGGQMNVWNSTCCCWELFKDEGGSEWVGKKRER